LGTVSQSDIVKRIAVVALSISPQHSGNKTYILNLLGELFRISVGECRYYVLCNQYNAKIFKGFETRNNQLVVFPSIVSNRYTRVLLEQAYLPLWLKRNKIDLLFAARNVMPLLAPCPTVIAIHSMHLNYKLTDMPWYQRIYGQTMLKASAQRSDAILAVSEYAGKTYAEYYHVSEDRLFVSYEGLKKFESTFDRSVNLPEGEFLLFVGTLFPHKNLHFLIRVFAQVAKWHSDTRLVVVGKDVNNVTISLKEQAQALGVLDNIEFRGYVSDTELMELYQNASVFVFPSLIEGFGLPVLEAMAHSIPVVASNRTSVPEIVGDAGIILDPKDEIVWANTIIELLEDKNLRHEMAVKGKERASKFTWRRSAEIALNCFHEVLSKANGPI